MKRTILLFFVLWTGILYSHAQMPTNGDYSNWSWENNDQNNWKRKDGSTWREIRPAFAPTTEKVGLMVPIILTMDFTYAKGWRLIFADFGGEYPYFVLYNIHKSLIRTYLYTEGQPIYSQLLVILQCLNKDHRFLAMIDNGINAIESNKDNLSEYVSCIMPGVGLNNWAIAEFPVLFDNKHLGLSNYQWKIDFYAIDQFNLNLTINGTAKPMNDQSFYTLTSLGNPVSGNTFSTATAGLTKLTTNVQSIEKLVENMHKSADKILENQNNENFLKDYANTVKSIKNYTDVIHAVSSGASTLSAIAGFVKTIFGITDPAKSTPPVAYNLEGVITGNMTIQRPLRGAILSIPGSYSYFPPNLPWQPYNCPIGIINLQKEPTRKRTTPYSRFGNNDNGNTSPGSKNGKPGLYNVAECPGNWIYASAAIPELCTSCSPKYSGKYIEYKLDEDIVLAKQNIEGLTLLDVKFALVCKPSGSGDRKYSINTPYIASHYFYSTNGTRYVVKTPNIVYKKIKEGQLIIHKYDIDNDEVYFGTPYVPMNQFKGVTIDVPEDTDVKLGVLATFRSDKYNDLILFKTTYNIKDDPNPVTASPYMAGGYEQVVFPFSNYYETNQYQLSNSPNSSHYVGKQIVLKPGFRGVSGFHATARDNKGNGNTVINSYGYNCENSMRSSQSVEEMTDIEDIEEPQINLYPNPCYGVLFIKLPGNDSSAKVNVYTLSGHLMRSYAHVTNESTLDVSGLSKGSYIFQIQTPKGNYECKVVIN